ncbi:DUF6531 domain-containing protein [Neisseria dumasiana]|uniref:DUF6531 domain-containing protein n=1 Tax=Neisseria dumasiana TaxID=1931275 RepID=UPI000A19B1ED|nr:DUF6531 domain-containing protein [Neisseria dumasiana]UOO83592.1 DUF6531 domain-containing protein [Neisseria dumasiana]UOO83595.1 DUF6531 domain-containing protein [Neisseria dumasiana]
MAINKIARKSSKFRVVFMVPDFCWPPPPAPPQVPPIPFPLFADLGGAKTVAKDVKINRKPAFVFKASKTNRTYGDEIALPGRKGVLSRTATKPAWPIMHSSSVKIRKRYIVRAGDMFHMNNKYKKKLPPKPCISCKAAAAVGRPVNPIHGLKFLENETDFAFEGLMPLVWNRSYYSDQDGTGWLGEGWSIPGSRRIIRDAAGLAYIDDQGRLFPLPEVDEDDEEPVLFESEQIWFSKNSDGHYVIASLNGSVSLRFAPLAVSEDDPNGDNCAELPLVAVEDANGNHQRFIYHPLTGLPQYIIDGNGRVFYLHFGNVADENSPKLRLLSVSLLDALPAVGAAAQVGAALVRYEYSSSGDLLRVIGRDGVVKRSFTYQNNLMVSHTDAAGLTAYYEYSHYTPTGKVLRNWTSLGEEWRFTYHDGYTEVTDVLGRTEQYHYDYNNELTKRVFADGSTNIMERDSLGRLLSHTDAMGRVTRYQYSNEGQIETIVRPDGAMLHFDYDDSYRLIRKSDAEGHYDSYTYDEAGNLLTHTDPLKHTTRFEYAGNGLLLSVTDPKGSTTEYHYDHNNQPDLITDCSGYQTKLAYTPEGQLARITDALGQHTEYHYDANRNLTLALYPDGSKETFRYDAADRLTAHTDGEGHTTAYEYGQDGLPTQRTNALGHTFGYHYDQARRLIGLTNENGARYRFAYDVLDRLVAESGFDHKLTAYHYNAGNELVQQNEYGDDASVAAKLMAQYGGQPVKSTDRTPLSDGLKDKTPLRITEFQRDILGRLKHTLAHDNTGNTQETAYHYDLNGNLVRAANRHGITCFDYNAGGQLIGQHQWEVPTKEENEQNGLPETDWRDPQYDMLFLPQTQSIRYHYDFNGNRTTTVLPDGRQINYLYYGSGHLHQINLDGEVVSDIERDKLHREIQRTQGALTSRYELDPLGRLKKQIAALDSLSESGKTAIGAGYIPARMHGQTAVKRSYGYDKTGNLLHSTDQRTGTKHFEYDKLGRITQAGNERFAFDPAHNILSTNGQTVSDGLNPVTDNRLKHYNGISYYYDDLGNLIHRELPNGEVQNYFYDLHDQLVKVEIFKKDGSKETWVYTYDALGRRVSKGRIKTESSNEVSDRHSTDHACLKTENSKDILDSEIAFLWDGSHLLQEQNSDGLYTYIYTDQDSYEPLAQIRDWTNEEETEQSIHYFHCDQIGIPREMTDKNGNLLWFGDYYGWGKLKSETNITETAHQPFRLQNQYCDQETGLHYNFFRYYEPDAGRFVNQDPIGLWGGDNFYQFASNTQVWIDPYGLNPVNRITGQAVQKASQLPIVRPGTRGWQQAIEALRKDGRGDVRVANMEDAKKLMKDAELRMDRRKMYTSTPYEKGYEVHKPQPGKDRQGNYCKAKERWEKGESEVGNDLPHIKWKKPGKQGQGHIFFED